MVEYSARPSNESGIAHAHIKTRRGVLFRMVAVHMLIGVLVLIAILVAFWQLNTYNHARQVWIDTQESLDLITNAQKDSTVLVLVVYRVVLTQAPFRNIEPETMRDAESSITVRIDDLEGWQESLELEAIYLPEDNPTRLQLVQASELMGELISIAIQSRDLIEAKDWAAANALIEAKSPGTEVLKIDRIHSNLLAELRRAYILTQQDAKTAQEQMDRAGYTAIGVTVSVLVLVIILGVALSVTIIRSITDPINELSRAATSLASGDFDVYVPTSSQDEFGHLAQVFNDMAARLGEIYAGMNQQIRELRIVLDETIQREKFAEIVDTDYFRKLTTEGAKLREIMNS